MLYMDVGLGFFALMMLKPSFYEAQAAQRVLRQHGLWTIYVATLLSALTWPLILVMWFMGMIREEE